MGIIYAGSARLVQDQRGPYGFGVTSGKSKSPIGGEGEQPPHVVIATR